MCPDSILHIKIKNKVLSKSMLKKVVYKVLLKSTKEMEELHMAVEH